MKRARPIFFWLARLAVGGLFLAACLAKIRDPEAFALAVNRYRILPGEAVNLVALFLPWLELTSGLALIAGTRRWRAAGAVFITGMLAVFTIAIALNLVRGIEASCGCFTTRADAAVSDGWNLLRNTSLIALSIAVFLDAILPPARPPSSPPESP